MPATGARNAGHLPRPPIRTSVAPIFAFLYLVCMHKTCHVLLFAISLARDTIGAFEM